MSDERRQILQMLADGKINADEAERLLAALDINKGAESKREGATGGGLGKPKFLHIKVEAEPGTHHRHENVDIKIPLILVKAGIKLGALMPEKARFRLNEHLGEKGLNIDLNQLSSEDMETILQSLTESSIDVTSDKEKVRIYCC